MLNDGARYFGPYASASSVRRTLSIVKKLFPWRSCTKVITGTDPRPCLDYFIHRCIAPCTAYCTKEEYDEVIRQTILFLEGKTEEVVKSLRREMQIASEALRVRARRAVPRPDRRRSRASRRSSWWSASDRTDEDVFGLARRGRQEACVQVFFIRGTQMVGRDFFTLDGVRTRRTATCWRASSSSSTSRRRTCRSASSCRSRCRRTSELIEQVADASGAARTVRSRCRSGASRRSWCELATENARESLDMLRARWLADTGEARPGAEQLQES